MASKNSLERTGTKTRLQNKTEKRIAEEQSRQDAEMKRQKQSFSAEKIYGSRDIFVESNYPKLKLEENAGFSSLGTVKSELKLSLSDESHSTFANSSVPGIKQEVDVLPMIKLEETLELEESICIEQFSSNFESFEQSVNLNDTEQKVIMSESESNQNIMGLETDLKNDEDFLQNHFKILKALVQQKDSEISLMVELIRGLQSQPKAMDSTTSTTKAEKSPIDTFDFSTVLSDATTIPTSETSKIVQELTLVLNGKDIVIRELTTKLLKLQDKIFGKNETSLEILKNYQPYFDCSKLTQLLLDEMKCVQCGKLCESKRKLENHLIGRHTERTISCSNCKDEFQTEAQLKKHMKFHADPEEWDWECEVCQKKFVLKKTLNKHMKIHAPIQKHPPESTSLGQLSKCSNDWEQQVESEADLDKNKRINDTQNIGILSCEICRRKYKSIVALNLHLEKCMDRKNWTLECLKCNKKFENEWKLYVHLKTTMHRNMKGVIVP